MIARVVGRGSVILMPKQVNIGVFIGERRRRVARQVGQAIQTVSSHGGP